MNWFTRLFSRNKGKAASTKTKTNTIGLVPETVKYRECTPPIAEDVDKLLYQKIQHFIPIRYLEERQIAFLGHKVLTYTDQSVIYIYGQSANYIYYLMEGEVTLQPNAQRSYAINVESLRAHFPINSGKLFGATAIAKGEVKILAVASDLTKLWTAKSKGALSCVELMDLSLPEELNNSRFFQSFAEAYRENNLLLPSLPDIAYKLTKAMNNDIGVPEAVEIIQIDSAIVSKLIQVVNSPFYAPVAPVTNCQDAVTRLGLAATRNLVMSISLKQLFSCKDPKLSELMHNLWRRSLYVSSLSFVLAEETGGINPDDALLAGLVCDIGIIPLLHFAEKYPDEYPDIAELEAAIPHLRAPIGTLVLHTLGFDESLTRIPHHSEDWHYDSGEAVSLVDIVMLAKLHSYFGTKQANNMPYINSIPAYAKLKDDKLTPEFSLYVLQKANQRIKDAMSVLA
jgi:HD-like signal output (HDOD) protein